jgi:hypothetical protein
MQEIVYILLILPISVLVLLFLGRNRNKHEKTAADEPFYIPGFLEKKPTEKQLRRVSDITTELLRRERNFNHSLKIMMMCKENIDRYQEKLIPINIRLSFKQTKP